jgi:hypothetical protein
MFYSTDNIGDLSIYKIRKISSLIKDFCFLNLGKPKNKKLPNIIISSTKIEWMGMYDPVDNEIKVFLNSSKTISDFVKVIIHEWVHYKQKILKDYNRLYKKYGYDDHPMEIEAHAAEKIWIRKALKYLRNNW